MNHRPLLTFLATLALLLPAAGRADDAAPPPAAPRSQPSDPIGGKLFPPDLIMGHQSELRIDDRQRDALLKELERAQGQFPRLQWQLQAATEQLSRLLDAPQVDESKALAQASEVMKLETEIKKTHLGLLIRLRNLLTEPQRAQLQAIRRANP